MSRHRPRRLALERTRRIALAAQGIGRRAPARADRRHLRRAMAHMQVLQLDSIPVVVRTQYLVLFSRVGPYPPELLDRLAWQDDEWLESWAHEASLVPIENEPLLRWRQARARAGETWKSLVRFEREHRGYVQAVLQEIAARGPLRVGELSEPRRRRGEWWSGRAGGSLALEWLYRTGALGIRRGPAFDKSYDLWERVVPEPVRARPTPDEPAAHRGLLRLAARALGVATAGDLADYFRLSMRDARPRIEELVEEGELEPVEIDGWPEAWLARGARTPRRIDARILLSPFDPLVWNRDRARRLFGFDYRIEIYVPAAQRRHGYYVLPFLLGDRLVARVDCKSDRKAGLLRVHGAWLEAGESADRVAPELEAELLELAAWLGLSDLELGRRGDLMPALRRLA